MWIISLFGFLLLILTIISPSAGDVSHLAFNGVNNNYFNDISLLRNAIRGEPNVDYPIYSHPPDTSFSCAGRHDGYYADTETRCQVFRVCANTDLTGHGFAFLCPNGTLFNQKHFVCDWHYNVDCGQSLAFYAKNEELGKRIDNHSHMMTMVRYMQNFVMAQGFGQTQPTASQSGSATAVFHSGGGSGGSSNFGPSFSTHAGGSSFGQSLGDSSSSATSFGASSHNKAHQKIYVSNLGELSTEPGSGFDVSKSNIINNHNLAFQQSGVSTTYKGADLGNSKVSSQPFHGKFNAVFSGSGNLIGLGSHVSSGSAKFSGSAVQSNSIYLPPRPPVQNTYIPPRVAPQVPTLGNSGGSGSTQKFPSFPGNLTLDLTDYGLIPDNLEGHTVRNRDVSSQFVITDRLSSLNGTLALRVPALDLLPPFPAIPDLPRDLLPPFEDSVLNTTQTLDNSTPLTIFVPDETTTEDVFETTTEDLPQTTVVGIEEPARDLLPPFEESMNSLETTTLANLERRTDFKELLESPDNSLEQTTIGIETTTENFQEKMNVITESGRGALPQFEDKSLGITTDIPEGETSTMLHKVSDIQIPAWDLLPPLEDNRFKDFEKFPEVSTITEKMEEVIPSTIPPEIPKAQAPANDLLPPFEDSRFKDSEKFPEVSTITEKMEKVFPSTTPLEMLEVQAPANDLLPPLEGKLFKEEENLQEISTTENSENHETSTPLSQALSTDSNIDFTTVFPEETVTESLGNSIDQVGLSSKNDIPKLILDLLPPLPPKENYSTTIAPTTLSDDEVQAKEVNDHLVDFDVMQAQMGGFFSNNNITKSQEIPTTEIATFFPEETTMTNPVTTQTTTTRKFTRTRATTQTIPRGFQTKESLMTTTISPRDSKDYARRLRNRMRQFLYVSQHSPAFTTPTVPSGFTRAPTRASETKTTLTTRQTTTLQPLSTTTKSASDLQVTTPPRVATVPTRLPTTPPPTSRFTVPETTVPTATPLLDIRFGDDEDTKKTVSPVNLPSMYFSVPLSPVEIKERELKKLGLLPRTQVAQDSAKEESALFPQRVQFTPRFDTAVPLSTGFTQTAPVSLYQRPQATSFTSSFSNSAQRATDIEIIPARGYYFNDPHERKQYYDAVARGLFNDHENGYVYIKPQFSQLQEVPRHQRVPTVVKNHELQHSGYNFGRNMYAGLFNHLDTSSDYSSHARPLKVLEARDTESSIFRGFDSYAAPLSHVGQLPTDTVYHPQSHSRALRPF